jgi:hypothetical protein
MMTETDRTRQEKMSMYIDDEYAKHKFSSPSSDSIPAAGPIKVELVWTNVVTRWPCTICGGTTEKVSVLAEGPGGIRVCEQCLECRQFNDHLERNARWHEDEAKRLRTLHDVINRLEIPTYQEWIEEGDRHEAWRACCPVEKTRADREKGEREFAERRARWASMTERSGAKKTNATYRGSSEPDRGGWAGMYATHQGR